MKKKGKKKGDEPGAPESMTMAAGSGATSVAPAPVDPPPGEAAEPSSAVSQLSHVLSVLVHDAQKRDAERAAVLVQDLGYRTIPVDDRDYAQKVISGIAPPDVLLVGLPGGEDLARAARARGEERPSVILALAGNVQTDEAIRRCNMLGADAYVTRPYKKEGLAPVLRSAILLRGERRRSSILSADLETERARPLRLGEVDPATGFHHFDFFKTLLTLELKRAKRYGYSLAACLVAIDKAAAASAKSSGLHTQVARALRSVIRDIDMPVDYADGKFLVFLPYTDLAGAERVGHRLEAAVRTFDAFDAEGHPISPSVSVGIAALKPGRQVSFAKLVRDASSALKAAQLKGGGRVVVRG
jgi:diguanylate cyclase (GGDEF)-like protein